MHHYWLYYGLFLSLFLFSSPLLAKMSSAFDGGEPENEGISLISTSEIKADTFSLSFQDVSLTYLMMLLAKESGRNIVVHPSAEQKLTLNLNEMTFDEMLEVILLYTNLHQVKRHGVIFLTNEREFHRLEKGELVTKVVTLDYAEAQELLDMLNSHAFDGGIERSYQASIGVDKRLNQLIITDQALEVRKIKAIIKQLDKPAKQVEIAAYIVAAFDDFAKELGANWGLNYQRGSQSIGGNISSEQQGTGNFGGNLGALTSLGVSLPTFSMAYMVLGNGLNLGLELSAMQSGGQGEIISNPIVLTTSRRAAYIKQGSEIAYSTSSNEGTNTQFKEAVMELNVTPQITPDHKIMIDIFISKDEVSGYTNKGEPVISKKELSTQAIVRHGETIVLGGIYEYETLEGSQEVPFLSKLPFLGRLFKKETEQHKKAELLIFISPRIVDTLID
ncbi:type IV pilus secretin PilQ [Ignatzschineria rhizosphaerae]|uniref:Type IV pilus secretin PilQ n=1 Tax=Ignatzschineria rhizosphaerae TaxID=2923279 RepID=A0ABY3X366_9GAMM|nr:type IV pilus secretin PilQ [Ignatzschineria rhizosphaerae]UNM96710.1 type IV pilus secretin PilQ [Ignatzschineria rhizosphaerae]